MVFTIQPVPMVNKVKVPVLEWEGMNFIGLGSLIHTVTIYSVRNATANHHQSLIWLESLFYTLAAWFTVIEDLKTVLLGLQ